MSPPQQWGQGGGGGYAPPPSGGGGGFGQPPGGQPPGGGGFGGQPPGGQPPGGQPPGGQPPGGGYGGGAPPGDAPLGKIPFSAEDETNITQTALFMRIAGGIAIASAVFTPIGSIGVALYRGTPVLPGVCGGAIGLLLQVVMAALLFVSANAFSKIVSSDGSDQQHLGDGLKQLRWYFLIKAILYLLMILFCCGCIVIGMVAGAALMSVIAGASQGG